MNKIYKLRSGLLVDFKKSPALGVRTSPRFSWIVPPCANGSDHEQTSYQIKASVLLCFSSFAAQPRKSHKSILKIEHLELIIFATLVQIHAASVLMR